MYGAILGYIIGSPYEFDRGGKTKEFPLFSDASEYTDDTIMALAVAEAFLSSAPGEDPQITREKTGAPYAPMGQKIPRRGLRHPVQPLAVGENAQPLL